MKLDGSQQPFSFISHTLFALLYQPVISNPFTRTYPPLSLYHCLIFFIYNPSCMGTVLHNRAVSVIGPGPFLGVCRYNLLSRSLYPSFVSSARRFSVGSKLHCMVWRSNFRRTIRRSRALIPRLRRPLGRSNSHYQV